MYQDWKGSKLYQAAVLAYWTRVDQTTLAEEPFESSQEFRNARINYNRRIDGFTKGRETL